MINITFAHPWLLALIPAAILVLIWLLRRDFVRADTRYADEKRSLQRITRARTWMFLSRATIITLLLIALAGPALPIEDFIEADPRITILQDTSNSMSVFEQAPAEALIQELRERVPVEIQEIGAPNQSALGDDILGQLREGRNLLLISDGQVTTGATLASVASFATSLRATLNALELPIATTEASISIHGPDYVIENTPSTWHINLHTTTAQPVQLEVLINEEVVLEEELTTNTQIPLEHSFTAGEHEITARIQGATGAEENTVFTRTVTATSKPRVLYVSQRQSGLDEIITTLYDADVRRSIPSDLSAYYAVILHDLPRATIRGSEQQLTSYAAQGNGVLVAGGENSYDFGDYQNTVLETLLPVRVGTGERHRGGANIVIALDLSGRTLGERYVDGERIEVEQAQDVQKALAIDVIEQLNPSNSVGVVGFTYPQTGVNHCTGACVIQRVQPLMNNREELIDKVARVDITGGTSHGVGMQASLQLLEGATGSKNVIFISDGISGDEDQQRALNAARTLAAQGGQVYAVLVGNSDRGASFMQALAQAGNGVYFRADQTNRLAILFGEPVDLDQGDAYDLVALNEHHFITQDLDLQATLFGYNQVRPKSASQLLLTSSGGDPVLTVWNYGVGRVAALTGFNGPDYGQLLQDPNSRVISRTINWLIGDPLRLETSRAQVPDGRVGEEMQINVTSPQTPSAPGVAFTRVENNDYIGVLTPQTKGRFEVLGVPYHVNYPKEYERLGISEELQEAVEMTDGIIFSNPSAQEVIAHAQETSRLKQLDDQQVRWPFLLAALVLFFVEVVVRRVQEIRRLR